MSDTLSLFLTALAAFLAAFLAYDVDGVPRVIEAIGAALVAAFAAVGIKRPGRVATPVRKESSLR